MKTCQTLLQLSESLPSLRPELTICLRVTQFYKTVLNLQRFQDASRMTKTRLLSRKQSRVHHFESWLPTQSVDSFTSDCSKDLTSRSFRTVQSHRESLFPVSSSLNSLMWWQVLWRQQVELALSEVLF